MLTAPNDAARRSIDPDEWWVERRLVARKLLDEGNAAPRLSASRAMPCRRPRKTTAAEHQFTAGWIALRFLNDPRAAAQHFARIAPDIDNPIAKARAGYWQGRAAEAAGRQRRSPRSTMARRPQYPTAYYGQIARAKLGMQEIVALDAAGAVVAAARRDERLEVLRAVALLYAIEERDLVVPVVIDLADKQSTDVGALTALADLCVKNNDARAMLLLGKTALGRDLPFARLCVPDHRHAEILRHIGPAAEPARGLFDRPAGKHVQPAHRVARQGDGPDAGDARRPARYIAKKFNVGFDEQQAAAATRSTTCRWARPNSATW